VDTKKEIKRLCEENGRLRDQVSELRKKINENTQRIYSLDNGVSVGDTVIIKGDEYLVRELSFAGINASKRRKDGEWALTFRFFGYSEMKRS